MSGSTARAWGQDSARNIIQGIGEMRSLGRNGFGAILLRKGSHHGGHGEHGEKR